MSMKINRAITNFLAMLLVFSSLVPFSSQSVLATTTLPQKAVSSGKDQ